MKERLEKLLEKACACFDEAEVFYLSSESTSLRVYEGETEEFSIASTGGVSLRAKSEGKTGMAYSESLEEEHLFELIEEVKESMELSEEEEYFFAGAEYYPEVAYHLPEAVDPDIYAEKLVGLERGFYAADSRIESAYGAAFSQVRRQRMLLSGHGFTLEDAGGYCAIHGSPIAKDKNGMVSGSSYDIKIDPSQLEWEAVLEEALERTLSQLGAKPVSSGKYPLLLTNTAASTLFGGFVGNFVAENIQKGRSLLKGKIGEKIASSIVEFIDDPFHETSLIPVAFDDEGVPVEALRLIQDGVLVDYLYNLKSAAKDGRTSNARGSRGISTPTRTSPHHMYMCPGNTSLEELKQQMGTGLLVTEITGYAGIDSVSGDFSVPIKGFYVENGSTVHPVNEVLIAGNFYQMMKDVQALGDALRIGSGSVLCPAMLFSSMQVSGK